LRKMSKIKRYKKLLLAALVLWIFFYLTGFLTGWWTVKEKLGVFPKIDAKTRLLVVAPHPDDEVLTSGGLIQWVLGNGGQVKIVFLTSGDGSRATIVQDTRKVNLSPNEFISLGEERMKEASKSTQILGVRESDVVFLGFPDEGLDKTYHRHFYPADGNYASATTKVDHVPYLGVLHPSQAYLGQNLEDDLKEAIISFSPTMVVTTHALDSHPDHKIAFLMTEEVKKELAANWLILGSLVHFKSYPAGGGYLFPPKKLFGSDWISLELTAAERDKKKAAFEAHGSQYSKVQDRVLFERLNARNEIFEIE